MNRSQADQAAELAAELIQGGADPQGLVHILYYPQGMYEEEIQGLSTVLPRDTDLSGYTSRYYTLESLCFQG